MILSEHLQNTRIILILCDLLAFKSSMGAC